MRAQATKLLSPAKPLAIASGFTLFNITGCTLGTPAPPAGLEKGNTFILQQRSSCCSTVTIQAVLLLTCKPLSNRLRLHTLRHHALHLGHPQQPQRPSTASEAACAARNSCCCCATHRSNPTTSTADTADVTPSAGCKCGVVLAVQRMLQRRPAPSACCSTAEQLRLLLGFEAAAVVLAGASTGACCVCEGAVAAAVAAAVAVVQGWGCGAAAEVVRALVESAHSERPAGGVQQQTPLEGLPRVQCQMLAGILAVCCCRVAGTRASHMLCRPCYAA